MDIWCRLASVLCLVWSFTACAGLSIGDLAHQTIPSLALSPIQASIAGPVASDQSAVSVSFNEPSMVLVAMPAGAFFSASSLYLSQNENGSIAIHMNGRSFSPLRGLDPALVNPDLLPFLFPSCDVPAVPLDVTR
ncbi:MAG: hypothetical protein Q8L77_00735 [Nitrospirota bacterium]|nr:hypothetical protein [Nitrospirota bacterium]